MTSADATRRVEPATWRIVEHRGREGLHELRSEWEQVYAEMPRRTPFHAWSAHVAYANHLATNPDQLRYLALRDERRTRLICPLEPRDDTSLDTPLAVWGIPWHPHWPIADVICPDDEARRAFVPLLAAHLRDHNEGRGLAVLGPLPEDSPLWDGLAHVKLCEKSTHQTMDAFVFDCTRPYDELLGRASSHFRKELRRSARRLAASSDVTYVQAGEGEEFDVLFEAFLAVESSGWKGANGTGSAIRLHEKLTAFYRDLARGMQASHGCEVSALYADGRCIAAEFSLRSGDEYATLKSGYDESYRTLGPGHLLCARTLERCCADPSITRYNQLTDAAWLHVWRPDEDALQQAHVSISPAKGHMLIALLKLRYGPGRRLVRWARRTAKDR
ncbi:MAG: GNAT family N-acetyltransferase [Thermoleophilia bacterium]